MEKKYKIHLTELAQEQIFQIGQYIREVHQATDTANKFLDRLENEISKLSMMPERIYLVDNEPWHSRGVHKYIVKNYNVYFVIKEEDNVVAVLSVVLNRRDQKKQLEGMEI